MKICVPSVVFALALFVGGSVVEAAPPPRAPGKAPRAGSEERARGAGVESGRHRARRVERKKAREIGQAARQRRVAGAATAAAVAPVAQLGATLLSESFTSGIPAGWAVIDNVGSGIEWTDLAGCGESGNFTSGTGDVACVSSDVFGPGNYDTELRTPVVDFSSFVAPASLQFNANYQNFSDDPGVGKFAQLGITLERFEVDYSLSGASGPWVNLLSWDEDHGSFRATPGEAVTLDIAAVVGQANVMFRFVYVHIDQFVFDWYAQVDDVVVTATPAGGGCILTCPQAIVTGNDAGQCGAVVGFSPPTTEGQCGPIVCAPTPGSFFPVGTTQVTCSEQIPTVTTLGPVASCSFDVTVNDVEAPVISCPADQNVNLPAGDPSIVVNFPAPTASDNCTNPVPTSCAPPSGSSFPAGTTPVSCTATDGANQSAGCGFDVNVSGGPSVLEIPTVSSIGLAGLALLLAGAGFVLLRRTH